MLALPPDVRLPSIFSDHLVLQRETRAHLWGWAEPGERVSVSANWADERKIEATPDASGRWQVELDTPAAGGPFTIWIHGKNTLLIHDVLVGEVWLASGQSNMEWTLGPGVGDGVEGWKDAAVDDPKLRVFDVQNDIALEPSSACHGEWKAATSLSTRAFSAVAFFFAHKLRAELDVPVGIVSADWGGTPAEAWTSAQGLATFPEFAGELARLAERARDPTAAAAAGEAQRVTWWQSLERIDPGGAEAGQWARASAGSEWESVQLPSEWNDIGLGDFDGIAWFARTVEIPAAWSGRACTLSLGPIDDMDTVYWNGQKIGGLENVGSWNSPRIYQVPPSALRSGENTLTVRVLDTGGLGGFTGEPRELELGSRVDAQRISLAGDWRWRRGASLQELAPFPAGPAFDQNTPSALWNAMVAPVVPLRFRGAIWYQGESNRPRADQYRVLFPALIRDWRQRFGQGDFPFFFVQIAPFGYEGDRGEAGRLRDAQRRALELPNTGMAVTMDVGDPTNIHPLKKREVGERLALWALAKTYGRAGLECSGPLYRAQTVERNALRLAFEHSAGLTSRGEELRHFTLAGADRVFHAAHASIEGASVLVSSPEVREPVAVRFGWGAADETNLWNAAGLPAACFRTDDWPEP